MKRAWTYAAAVLLLPLTACSVLFPLDEFGPGPSSNPEPPPGMVLIDRPGGKTYIDRTEVTRGAYKVFTDALSTGQPPDVSDRPCSWNMAYTAPDSCLGDVYKGPGSDNHPQICVDWCDAYAYCKWAGKRLCGHLGGGALTYSDYTDRLKSEWMNACVSGNQSHVYPYGNTYQPLTCNGTDLAECDAGTCTTVPVASLHGCTSTEPGYEGVFDLSGNVWEWEDACDANNGEADNCRRRGGSFDNQDANLKCTSSDVNASASRNKTDGDIGFRCCASAPGG